MTPSLSVWMVLLAALIGANLPFVNDWWLAVIPRRSPKTVAMRAAELLVLYFLVGAFGMGLEQSLGQNYPQGWEFYATTIALFVTLAFPGFVYRYLYLRRH